MFQHWKECPVYYTGVSGKGSAYILSSLEQILFFVFCFYKIMITTLGIPTELKRHVAFSISLIKGTGSIFTEPSGGIREHVSSTLEVTSQV